MPIGIGKILMTFKHTCLFDTSISYRKYKTGIENYTSKLFNLLNNYDDFEFIDFYKISNYLDLPSSDFVLREKLLSLSCNLIEPSLFFSPFYPIPNFIKCPKILTVHDVIPLINPDWFPDDMFKFFNTNLRNTIENNTHIITDSHSTKKDILSFYDIQPENITVIHLGKDIMFSPNLKSNTYFTVNGIIFDFKYLLSVCTLEPRKNIRNVIESFNLLKSRCKLLKDLKLVLTGSIGWKSEINLILSKSPFRDDIIVTGYVDDSILYKIYANAEIFLYPSFYEGFGLPLIEAMSSGVPVVTSNNSSLQEVGGDAVIYANPHSAQSISDCIECIIFDQNLKNELIHNGLKRSKLFTWEKTAKETLEVFKKVVNL